MANKFDRDDISRQVESLFQEEKYQEIIDLLLPLESCFTEGDKLYLDLADAYRFSGKYTESFRIYKEQADKNQDHYAEAMVGGLLIGEMGVKYNPVEALTYFKRASESDDSYTQTVVMEGMAILYEHGDGVNRDIPLSFKYYKKALELNESEELKETLENLKKKYPLTEDGEIDINVRKRSKIASFLLWCGIVLNVLLGLNFYFNIENLSATIASVCCALVYVLVLGWNKISFPLLVAMFGYGLPAYGLLMQAASTDNIDYIPLHGIMFANSIGSFFVLLSLLRRKEGFAHPWYSLLRIRDNGCGPIKRIMNVILVYGKGNAFKNGSPQMKNYNVWRYVGLALIVVLAIIAAWNVATMDMGMEIEWNCFNNSGMLTILSVIGFFLQFTKGMWVKSSYETYDVYEDQYGNVKKIEKNRDMLTTIEGNFLFPLLCHFLLYPLMIGIMLYYIIMGGFALLQGVMPYLLGLLVLASPFVYYRSTETLFLRKYRMILLVAITTVTALVYLSIGGVSLTNVFDVSSVSQKEIVQKPTWQKFIVANKADVNLRKSPDSNSPKLMEEEGEMDSYLVWSDVPKNEYGGGRKPYRLNNGKVAPVLSETGNWYEVLVQLPWANTVRAYIMKSLCKEVVPAPMKHVNFYKIPSGKFEGKYLYYDSGGVYAEPSSLSLGWETDGGYLFPKVYKHSFDNEGGQENYDFDQLTGKMIEQWFTPLMEIPVIGYTLYYYFGGEWPTTFYIDPETYPSELK